MQYHALEARVDAHCASAPSTPYMDVRTDTDGVQQACFTLGAAPSACKPHTVAAAPLSASAAYNLVRRLGAAALGAGTGTARAASLQSAVFRVLRSPLAGSAATDDTAPAAPTVARQHATPTAVLAPVPAHMPAPASLCTPAPKLRHQSESVSQLHADATLEHPANAGGAACVCTNKQAEFLQTRNTPPAHARSTPPQLTDAATSPIPLVMSTMDKQKPPTCDDATTMWEGAGAMCTPPRAKRRRRNEMNDAGECALEATPTIATDDAGSYASFASLGQLSSPGSEANPSLLLPSMRRARSANTPSGVNTCPHHEVAAADALALSCADAVASQLAVQVQVRWCARVVTISAHAHTCARNRVQLTVQCNCAATMHAALNASTGAQARVAGVGAPRHAAAAAG
ncbi:hypothetical protein EON66_04410 [archaeon]|nr:MAG: hypothetical protein EON66_04410 [archaeon]